MNIIIVILCGVAIFVITLAILSVALGALEHWLNDLIHDWIKHYINKATWKDLDQRVLRLEGHCKHPKFEERFRYEGDWASIEISIGYFCDDCGVKLEIKKKAIDEK